MAHVSRLGSHEPHGRIHSSLSLHALSALQNSVWMSIWKKSNSPRVLRVPACWLFCYATAFTQNVPVQAGSSLMSTLSSFIKTGLIET